MFSSSATVLMEHLVSLYKKSGENRFYYEDYKDVPDYASALSELQSRGLVTAESNDINSTVSLSPEAFNV